MGVLRGAPSLADTCAREAESTVFGQFFGPTTLAVARTTEVTSLLTPAGSETLLGPRPQCQLIHNQAISRRWTRAASGCHGSSEFVKRCRQLIG